MFEYPAKKQKMVFRKNKQLSWIGMEEPECQIKKFRCNG